MSESIKIICGEVIPVEKDSDKSFKEYKIEKENKLIGYRFKFKVKTRINDRIENCPVLYRRCSYFLTSAEDTSKIRNSLVMGAVLDIDGTTNRRNFLTPQGEKIWYDEIEVKKVSVIQPSVLTPSSSTQDQDLPF